MIDLKPDWLKIVKQILQNHIPDRDVVVFGSRIKSKAKPYSDLDLCIRGNQPVSLETLSQLKEDFSDSDLPIRVDIVDWANTDPAFKSVIEGHYETVQEKKK